MYRETGHSDALHRLAADESCVYEKPSYSCIWQRNLLEDKFCRIDRTHFRDKTTGRVFPIDDIEGAYITWIDIPGGIFRKRKAGYQLIGIIYGAKVVLMDATDPIGKRHSTECAQALCDGEKNILKVALASILLIKSHGDLRRSYFEVFDRYGSDMHETFPWPVGSFR